MFKYPQIKGKTIAIVSDDRTYSGRLAMQALVWGMQVQEHSSAESMLDAFSGTLWPDFLLADHLLPGMNGVKLARLVTKISVARSRRPALILMAAAGADSFTVPPGLVDYVLYKPIGDRMLQGLIYDACANLPAHSSELALSNVEVEAFLNLDMIEEFTDDPGTYEMIVDGFSEIIADHGRQMMRAIEQNDLLELSKHLHMLVGSSGNIGLKKLYQHFKAVQKGIHDFNELPDPSFISEALDITEGTLLVLKFKGIVSPSFEW